MVVPGSALIYPPQIHPDSHRREQEERKRGDPPPFDLIWKARQQARGRQAGGDWGPRRLHSCSSLLGLPDSAEQVLVWRASCSGCVSAPSPSLPSSPKLETTVMKIAQLVTDCTSSPSGGSWPYSRQAAGSGWEGGRCTRTGTEAWPPGTSPPRPKPGQVTAINALFPSVSGQPTRCLHEGDKVYRRQERPPC